MTKRRRTSAKGGLRAVVASLAAVHPNPAELIELVYWSREPGLVPALRALAGMNAEARAALCAFLGNAPNPEHIRAQRTRHELLLTTRNAGTALGFASGGDKPALVN